MAYDITIDAAPTTTRCPKCEGSGRCRTTLPGGWLIRPCGPCSGSGLVDAAPCCGGEAETEPCRGCRGDVPAGVRERDDADARRAVCELRADYLCDRPDFAEDVPYEPTPEDERWYAGLCREREERIWTERIAADEPAPEPRTFVQTLFDVANVFGDLDDAALAWLGGKVARLAEQARWLDAKDGEMFDDRMAASLAEARWAAEARAVTREAWAPRAV